MKWMVLVSTFVPIVLLYDVDKTPNIPFWIMIGSSWIIYSIDHVVDELKEIKKLLQQK